MEKDQAQQARHLITRLLARREHSYEELLQKLAQRDIDPQVAQRELQKFVDKGLQSDHKFVLSLVQSLANNGKGPHYIQQKLNQHGIEAVDLNKIAEDLEIDWFENALRAKIKRFGEECEQDWQAEQKQKRFLYSRGFSQEQIAAAVSFYCD